MDIGLNIRKNNAFERKTLRKTFGPTKELNGLWKSKTNEEQDELIQRKKYNKIYKIPKAKTVRPCRKNAKEREDTIIYKWKPLASRPIGRPKNRWEDDVRKDLENMLTYLLHGAESFLRS